MSNFLKLSSTTGLPTGTAMVLGDLPSIANNTILGNVSGISATPTALTATQVTAFLNQFSSSLQGVVPGSGGGTTNFLRADGTWAAASPLTTKGDIYTFSTTNARQPVPGDYGRLIPDSTQTTGWRSAPYTSIQQGSPGKNYIQYADFENNSTTGWSLGTIGTLTNGLPTGSPTFGSGASGNLSISTVSSGQLAGSYSLSYASSAATTQGNMLASQAYTIDSEDQAKVLTIKFYYSVPSGVANCNFSGSSSNSFAWAVYDVTNSSWLSSAGNFNLVQNSGAGYVTGTCQTNSNTSQIRLVIYNANATSGAATLYLDDFYVGPQTAPMGPAVSDTVAYIPTFVGFGTPTNVQAYSRRVGDRLLGIVNFTSGTPTATTASISIGYNGGNANVVIDTTKIANATASQGGSNLLYGANSANTATVIVPTSNGSVLNFGVQGSSFSGDSPVTGSTLASNGLNLSFIYDVPIVGWSSNTSMSSDTDTRVISFTGTQSSQSVTASVTDIAFTATKDRAGAWNGTQYVVPVSGDYWISLNILNISAGSTTYVYYNGSNYGVLSSAAGTSYANSGALIVSGANAGDTISVRVNSTGTVTGGNLSIFRIGGPAVVAATESVNAFYNSTQASGTLNSSFNPVTIGTKVKDTHNAFNGTTYVIPVSGSYSISAGVAMSFTAGAGPTSQIQITKNGSPVATREFDHFPTQSGSYPQISIAAYPFNAGDTIQIAVFNNATSPSYTNTTASYNYFSVARTGN